MRKASKIASLHWLRKNYRTKVKQCIECSCKVDTRVVDVAKTKHDISIALEKNIESLAGEAVSKKIIEGIEEIMEKNDKKLADWVKGAIESLVCLSMVAFYSFGSPQASKAKLVRVQCHPRFS